MQMKPQRNKMLERFHSLRNVRKGTQMSNRRRADSSEEGFQWEAKSPWRDLTFSHSGDTGRHSTMDSLSQGYRTGCMHLYSSDQFGFVSIETYLILAFSLLRKIVLFTGCIDCSHVYTGRNVIYLIAVFCVEVARSSWKPRYLLVCQKPFFIYQQCLSSKTVFLNSLRWIQTHRGL